LAASPLQIGDVGGRASEALGAHELSELLGGGTQLLDHDRRLVDKPDLARLLTGFLTRKQSDRGIHRLLLLAEIENVAVGFAAVQHAVGAGKGLDQAMVPEVLIHIQRVQILGVKTGEQHVHHNRDVDLVVGCLGVGFAQILLRPLLIFDARLHILVVEIEVTEAVIGPVAAVVISENDLEGCLLAFGILLIIELLLR